MSDLKICRVCLCKDVKMYDYNEYNLKHYYAEVMDQNLIEKLPQYFCYTCATLLYKFHKFKQKCHNGQEILKTLLWNKPVTLLSLSKINKESEKLKSTLNILTVSKRVKTYNIIRKSLKHINPEEKPPPEKLETDQIDERVINKVYLNDEISIEDDNFDVDEQKISSDEEKINIDEEIKEKITTTDEDKNNIIVDNLNGEWDNIFTDSDDDKLINKKPRLKNEVLESENIDSLNKATDSKTSFRKKDRHKDKNTKSKGTARKKSSVKTKTVKSKTPYIKPKLKHLDPKYWLKVTFTEEEALDNFKAKACDPKYLSAAYRCDKCYKGFSTLDIYCRHMKLVHCESRGPLECRFCGMRFKKKFSLRPHMLAHYHRFQCLRCKLVFHLESSAHVHNDIHSGVERECTQCGVKFRHLNTYYTHMRIYHRSEHVCTVCGVSFVSAYGLKFHKRVKHFNSDHEPPAEGENTYCVRCDIKFETKQAYDEHFRESVKHADDDALKVEDNDQNKVPTSDVPAPLKGRGNRGPARGKGKCPTQCFVCEKNFESFYRYKKHHEAEHKDVPIQDVQVCEICGATVKSIARHMNLHTKEKVYTCATCGVKFYSKSSSNRHQLTHTGEKPYKCPLCEKRFTQKGSMQLHYRTFHLKEPYPKRNKRYKNGKDDGDIFEHFNSSRF